MGWPIVNTYYFNVLFSFLNPWNLKTKFKIIRKVKNPNWHLLLLFARRTRPLLPDLNSHKSYFYINSTTGAFDISGSFTCAPPNLKTSKLSAGKKMGSRQGPPKHQNKFAWVPKAGVKINETVKQLFSAGLTKFQLIV